MKRCRRAVWSERACFPLSAAICLIWVLLCDYWSPEQQEAGRRRLLQDKSSLQGDYEPRLCRDYSDRSEKQSDGHGNLACRTWPVLTWAALLLPLILWPGSGFCPSPDFVEHPEEDFWKWCQMSSWMLFWACSDAKVGVSNAITQWSKIKNTPEVTDRTGSTLIELSKTTFTKL